MQCCAAKAAGRDGCDGSRAAGRSLQHGPEAIFDGSIMWPRESELADAMRRFKARGKTQHDSAMSRRPADPAGYLVDAELALVQGLTDHVFPTAAPLAADRLTALLGWLELQAIAFPRAAVRSRLMTLRERLSKRKQWERDAYESAVRGQVRAHVVGRVSMAQTVANGANALPCRAHHASRTLLHSATPARRPRRRPRVAGPHSARLVVAWSCRRMAGLLDSPSERL